MVPIVAAWLYWLHRLTGPRIMADRAELRVLVAAARRMVVSSGDPRGWGAVGPESGVKYFEPSLARTSTGNFIPARALQNDESTA